VEDWIDKGVMEGWVVSIRSFAKTKSCVAFYRATQPKGWMDESFHPSICDIRWFFELYLNAGNWRILGRVYCRRQSLFLPAASWAAISFWICQLYKVSNHVY